MKRSLPLKNSGFSKSITYMDREARLAARTDRMASMSKGAASHATRAVMQRVSGCVAAVPKECAIQSDAYERAAKGLGYCMRCSCHAVPLTGALDFCHADLGKGQGIKTDSRRGWPGCRSCHDIVGRELPRTTRRAVEYLLGVMTRSAVEDAGTWPVKLSKWDQLNARSA